MMYTQSFNEQILGWRWIRYSQLTAGTTFNCSILNTLYNSLRESKMQHHCP